MTDTQPTPEQIEALKGRVSSDYDLALWQVFFAAALMELKDNYGFSQVDCSSFSLGTMERIHKYLGMDERPNGKGKRRKGFK